MIGFGNVLALGALALVLVPVIIHLLKRRQRRQVVPSLMLFAQSRTRRRRVPNDLLLLLARATLVALVALLLARPFTPGAAGGGGGRKALGLLIDNSLDSMASVGGVSYFDLAVSRARRLVDELAPDDLVLLATTATGACSRPFPARLAGERLGALSPLPRSREIRAAAAALAARLAEVSPRVDLLGAALLAPPNERLWPYLPLNEGAARKIPLVVDPLSAPPADPIILDAAADTEGNLTVRFGGTPSAMSGAVLTVADIGGGELASRVLGLESAIDGTIFLRRSELGGGIPGRLSLTPPDAASPGEFAIFFPVPPERPRQLRSLIVYDDTPVSALHARILFVALGAALPPEAELAFLNISGDPPSMGGGGGVVFVCPLRGLDGERRARLAAALDGAARLVFLPAAGADGAGFAGIGLPSPPRWAAASRKERGMLVSPASGIRHIGAISAAAAASLQRASVGLIRPPLVEPGDTVVLEAGGGEPVLTRRELPSGADMLLWGIPLEEDAIPLLASPAFPLLIKSLADINGGQAISPLVGNRTNIAEWLGVESGSAIHLPPGDGDGQRLVWGGNNSPFLFLETAGIHRFELDGKAAAAGGVVYLPVNLPRVDLAALDPAALATRLGLPPGRVAVNAKPEFAVSAAAGGETDGRPLTAALVSLIWLALMVEMTLCARR